MEGLSRQEYPAMLEHLQPAGAVSKFNERVNRIGKVNIEIANWLQERRKVEEAYVQGLKKLSRRQLQDVGSDLGVFEAPWRRILDSTDSIANSHQLLSQRIEKDVEQPLRAFASTNREMQAMATIQGNLVSMAKDLEDAQEKSDKLSKKGGKASAQKVDNAASRLQSANQQWASQAPFIFETLQALDETRLNHLRDVLTQYETNEADQIERSRVTVEQTLGILLEIDTAQEINNWASTVSGKPKVERSGTQYTHNSSGSASTNLQVPPPPPIPRSRTGDSASQHSGKFEHSSGDSKIKRLGTMLGRRRQSIHGGFARATSPKPFPSFTRNSSSRDGGHPLPSPRASSSNLRESPSREHNRLSSLAESPQALSPASQVNGTSHETPAGDIEQPQSPSRTNGVSSPTLPDLSDVQPPPGPPPSHLKPAAEMEKDSEGYSVPAARNDPISQAESEAAQESEQPSFRLDIKKEPILEHDDDARAALSNVANTLRSSSIVPPNRKAGTVRGRRDVRNTIFVPPQPSNNLDVSLAEHPLPPSPGPVAARAAALAALSSGDRQNSAASDTTSIRSGHSLSAHTTVKHPDMHGPGLNASIVETVSASFENGAVTSARINGEIALTYNAVEDEEVGTSADQLIRINDFPALEAIGPNRTFIHPVSPDKPDEFTVDISPSARPKSSVAFTYRVHIDEANIASHVPLLIKPSWKAQGDKLGLVIEYCLNPEMQTNGGELVFNNLVLMAMYEGARATGCQTKPTGTHLKEKSLVYWRLGDLTLDKEWHKVICRFIGAEGAELKPGHIEARWEVHGSQTHPLTSGISISRLDAGKGKEKEEMVDPFADESAPPADSSEGPKWVEIETAKKYISGKYEGRQVV
ncbi:Muniscin C-terminal mu homology domain-containing protein [Xylogone sp. PMI_703]|nr:Muniscin C-terminal mu homology domain-containing protein [Xylogone sp. PMI_703]